MSDEIKQPPTYPVTCPKCGVTYGPGSKISNHRPGGMSCVARQGRRKKFCPECGEARTCRACVHEDQT